MAEWKPIEELFDFEKGTLQSSKCTAGKYTFITAAEEWKTHEAFTHDCEALVFAMAASGSLGRTHYVKGKFISSDLCFILTPKKGLQLDLTFYYRLFNFLRSDIVKKTATGTSKLAINQTNFGTYKLPYFDYEHQLSFSGKIETITGINEEFSEGMDYQLSLLIKLRQAVLQEAIEGKLTAEWRKQNPKLISGENHASKLLEKIKTEKERLIKEGKIKKDKPLSPITDAEKPFELPEGWIQCRYGEVISLISGQHIEASDCNSKKEGFPYITGPADFGDVHPNVSKWTIRPKVFSNKNQILITVKGSGVGKLNVNDRDGLVISRQLMAIQNLLNNNDYCFIWLKTLFLSLQNSKDGLIPGIGRDNILFRYFPLPPLAEQHAIVERAEKLMAMIDELEKHVTERKAKSKMLMQSVLQEAFDR